ncbi:toll-like receptor 4 [Lytechinus pictus]|uniref:toll-like receptor 4 n=1 Tax=Lytechinus pictus TaxID=7653 RepID=UPI0030BA0FEE
MSNSSGFYSSFFVNLIIISSILYVHGIVRDEINPSFAYTNKPFHGCDIEKEVALCNDQQLNDVPQDLPQDIEWLDLSLNHITVLLNSSFTAYPIINTLDIYKNNLRLLESATFYPLKFLRWLDLSNNNHLVLPVTDILEMSLQLSVLHLEILNLTSIQSDTLKSITHIRELYLSDNTLSSIKISFCTKVDVVDMSNNKIHRLTPENFTLTCIYLCHKDVLDLVGNPIEFVNPEVIASLQVRLLRIGGYHLSNEILANISLGISKSDIEELTILSGFIGEFPKVSFDPLHDSSLLALTFNQNGLENFRPLVFSNLTRLKRFSIHENYFPIEKVQPNFFYGMEALEKLDIVTNRVSQINSENQTWTLNITHFNLRQNMLRKITESTFRGLRNLAILNKSYNDHLVALELTAFSGLDNIQTIDLSLTSINVLDLKIPTLRSLCLNGLSDLWLRYGKSSPFQHLHSLVYLSLVNSNISPIFLFDELTNASLFDGLLNLHYLDLSKNDLFTIFVYYGMFWQLTHLNELKLDSCQINMLHPLLFSMLESLQKLSLKRNQIRQFDGAFFMLSEIRTINLEGNRIYHLDNTLFANNEKLLNLSLAYNELTSLSESTFKPFLSSLLSIDLSGNQIVCNCDLKWLIYLLIKQVVLENEEFTFCSPASLGPIRRKSIQDFDPDELCGYSVLVSSISLCLICLLFIAGVVYHYRWQFKFRLFLLNLAVLGYKEMRDARDQNDYKYDINIMFYDDDEEWIQEHLRPALQEHLPQFQRNVFGDEGLVLGMHYLDAVDHAVTHSYKTIIVLSRAAVRDHWFILKFRTAMDHVSDTLIEFVLAIFLEDIPDDEMPFLVRLYLSDGRPYINWTDDVRGHEYFWNELSKRLTFNLRTNDMIPNE